MSEAGRGGARPGVIEFDEELARHLERMYLTPDVVAQRARVLQAMELRSGDRVLDVGVGPGLLAHDLACCVGPDGRVAGVDTSPAMLAMTRDRCAEQDWTDFQLADATELPFEDEGFDAVVSTQVYEYVSDIDAALAEAWRVLRPAGRLFVLDTDWDSLVWRSRDRARMERVLRAWDEHLAHPHLPAFLGGRLREAGFQIERREIIPMFNPEFHPHSYSAGILGAIQAFVPGRAGVTQEEADAWALDLRELGAAGDYFFSLNRYLFVAVKPA